MRLALLPLLMLTTAAAPLSDRLDINESGRVLATLDDWRAIIFVLLIIIVLQMIERWGAARSIRQERAEIAELVKSLGPSTDKVAEALFALKTEMVVLRALTSRVESNLG